MLHQRLVGERVVEVPLTGHGRLHVGGVSARAAPGEDVLADGARHHELVVDVAADGAGVGLDRGVAEPHPLEHPAVGVVHGLVRLPHALRRGVEGVGVLHDELTAAEEAVAGTGLVAELGLDLVHVDGQVPVGLHVHRHGGRHHLLVGGPEHERPALAPQPEEDVLHGGEAAGLGPDLFGLEHRHEHLLGPGRVHLLADYAGDLLENAPPEGQVGVDPRRHPADVAGPHQQLVADRLGVGRGLQERPHQQPGHSHGGRG
jgi:hypothetical protein